MGIRQQPLPHGYRWLCISDPYGIFQGRIFRKSDLEPENPEDNWLTDGMVFHHTKKPIICRVEHGRLVKVSQEVPDATL